MNTNTHRGLKYTLLAIVIAIAIAAALLYRPIHNRLTLDSASPVMKQLAAEAGMNEQGQLLFYRADPTLDSLQQMSKDCANKSAQDGYVEQGCFDPSNNHIYIRKMPAKLTAVETVTAAHEMLHAAYKNLSSSQRSSVDKLLEKEVKTLDNAKLNSRLKEYSRLEPGARDNELHSILGTEFKDLMPALEKYYSQYFSDRDKPVAANTKINNLFQENQDQLASLRSQIIQAKAAAKSLYAKSVAAAKAGDAQGDKHYYNLYTDKVDTINAQIDHYNQLLDQYNALSSEYNGQPASQLPSVKAHGAS